MTTTDDIVMEHVTREDHTTDGVGDVEMVEESSEKTSEASSFTPESIPGPSSRVNFQGIYFIILNALKSRNLRHAFKIMFEKLNGVGKNIVLTGEKIIQGSRYV